MSPKTIFKILLATIIASVLGSLIVEVININTTGYQINNITRVCVQQACDFYGQETYKRDINSISNLEDIIGTSGSVAVSGEIYGSNNAQQIYDSLYTNKDDFRFWAVNYIGLWKNLDYLLFGLGFQTSLALNPENYYIAKSYYDNRMTPLNLGITYLDKETTLKIFRWNLAKTLSNGQDGDGGMVVDTDGSRVYVKYKGFRIYTSEAEITDISYQLINIVNERDKFMELTNIDSSKLGINNASDERATVCLAGIKYSVPVAYQGITPFRKILEFVGNRRVNGLTGGNSGGSGTTIGVSEGELQAGGFYGTTGLPVPGSIIYYVLR